MRIGNKLFPYPVLTVESNKKGYKNNYFSIQIIPIILNNDLQLTQINIKLNNDVLRKLVETNKASIYIYVDCSQTLFRKKYKIDFKTTFLKVNLDNLRDKTSVSSFIVMNEDVKNILLTDVEDDYNDVKFSFNKDEIIGYDDGFVVEIAAEDEFDNKKNTFLVVTKSEKINDTEISIESHHSKISVNVSYDVFDRYYSMKNIQPLENFFFSIFALLGLYVSLEKIMTNPEYDFEEIESNYRWFSILRKTYKRKFNQELTEEIIKENIFEFCQKIIDNPIGKSVQEIQNLLKDNKENEYED